MDIKICGQVHIIVLTETCADLSVGTMVIVVRFSHGYIIT